ncbi:holo-[acyl-carrier-protein] synthase [Exophiala oligosperma]|uniref:Holo-[acyl-carrier-protein] synthase n=1 Tax=Exophiala oligosperma TaxID=215243 RepID=A0A0D2DKS9_9EURO|nr:holo-[acyl-carrier-protein] synthase [Exophiala oligosperma]KIW43558.1 holo-[acyl-carrier-protein] synthase [Exophiala oligosperma]
MAVISATRSEALPRADTFESKQQLLACKLLIELLSYQFASPVRWIETQKEMLRKANGIERYVEIGPARILATMIQKSASQGYSSQAASHWSHFRFLSSADNKNDIYYEYSEQTQPDPSGRAGASGANVTVSASLEVKVTPPPASTNVNASVATSMEAPIMAPVIAALSVPDASLLANHVVLAITAQKLKKAFDQVPIQKTIRELSGGKSTLQNELIGDLAAEFGSLPDGSEDLSLEALGESLQASFAGKPGKQLSALISKFISGKMPAGFNQAAVQDHLQEKWGLNKSHALIPISLAVTAEPASRLPDANSAKEFFDAHTLRYGAFVGISLTPLTGQGGALAVQATVTVDSAGLEVARKEQRDYHLKQFELLAKYLQINPDLEHEKLQELAASEKLLEEKLNRWAAEFDDHFFDGIQPLFDIRKSRTYDSWWNWAREDLLRLLSDFLHQPFNIEGIESDDKVQSLLSRFEPSCLDIVQRTNVDPQLKASSDLGREIARLGTTAMGLDPVFKYTLPSMRPSTSITATGLVEYTEVPRTINNYSSLVEHGRLAPTGEHIPFVHIRRREDGQEWKYDRESTNLLLSALQTGTTSGITFTGKTILVIGAGANSIGAEVVKGLLCGGARVIVTTSRAVSSTAKFYQRMYRKHGARGSALSVVPFNQGSRKDCEALIEHIYSPGSVIGENLDFIIPFAAIPESGAIDGLDSKSELAHRAMLTNILRLLGYICKQKEARGLDTQPTTVILPLSPNHGTFGGDGMYAESKLGLETLFNRFHSESWSAYLNICGAVIGWTRGTGLMNANNIVAEAIESHDVVTFSQAEMAFNILALMTPAISTLCEDDPVYADLNGGLQFVHNLKQEIVAAREKITDTSKLRKALIQERSRHQVVLKGSEELETKSEGVDLSARRANLSMAFPRLSTYEDLTQGVKELDGMLDLSRIVAVVGFSELGPWGSARTRWEMEHQNQLSLEGYVELSWIMGLVKHKDGEVNGKPYTGWVDTETQQPVKDEEFKEKYHDKIMNHTGIRFIESEALGGYDPKRKEFLHEIVTEDDLPAFESSKATAEAFKLRYQDKVTIEPISGSDEYKVRIKKGAHFLVPKASAFDREIAGQLPKGWDPKTYGIPEDIVQQTDPVTLYALCCVSEALLSSGIQDPYELYKHIHVSELANCIGTGAGPLLAMRGVYRDRHLDKPVQSDILQESFLNTMGAWINMLILSSTGPIKSPVGACATAIESLDIGCEAIQGGKCKVAIVGGCDDFQEEMSYEFAKMKATASSNEEFERGRTPQEMSRPSAASRGGFVESAGCGVQLLMSADLALKMGLPIYGVVAYTQMASDKIGRSVPAPGKGILTAARELSSHSDSHLLDLEFRRNQLQESFKLVKVWEQSRLEEARQRPDYSERMAQEIHTAATTKIRSAKRTWGNDLRLQDPHIAPLKSSLAAWGLTVDDITVASMHGTSTKANDTNEADVINTQLTHLGRTRGNPILAVCQKSLTGHPKGAAGAWQFNGCLQMLQTGIVPGNKNADNIEGKLRQYEHIVYPMEAIRPSSVDATMLTSFGFGQNGGIAIAVASKYLFSAAGKAAFNEYRARATTRQRTGNIAFQRALMSNSIFKAKERSPWDSSDARLKEVLLNPRARVSRTESSDTFTFKDALSISDVASAVNTPREEMAQEMLLFSSVHSMLGASSLAPPSQQSVGIDVENIVDVPVDNENFIGRNFTVMERELCSSKPDPRASYAGRWCAKEAVMKSLQIASRGPGAAMDEIEILHDDFGVPKVELFGKTKEAAEAKGVSAVQVSITHSAGTATAIALASRGS